MGPATVAMGQGIYDLTTGVWPLLSMRTFLAVTGPKADLWLVRAIGLLTGSIGAALLAGGLRRRITPELRFLGLASALSLGGIDVTYVARRRISPIYLLDALAQAAFVAMWARR